MAYSSWSVVFGEQPSAAKWNILGTNDAHFDSLIGLSGSNTIINNLPYQSNTTNTTAQDSLLIQRGWGFLLGDGANRSLQEDVTFPVAFSEVPTAYVTITGVKVGSDPSSPNDNAGLATMTVDARMYNISTTTLQVQIIRSSSDGADPGVLGATTRYIYTWLAIGVK